MKELAFSPKEFAARRQKLINAMGPDSIAILFTSPHHLRNNDTEYPYRPDSDFYYLTGFKEPESVALFIPNGQEGEFILFNRPRDPKAEQWSGKRLGQEEAKNALGVDQAYPIEKLEEMLPKLLLGKQRLFYTLAKQDVNDKIILQALAAARAGARAGVQAPTEISSFSKKTSELRLIKSKTEIEVMRYAVRVSAQAHKRGMAMCKPGMYEYQLEAEYVYEFMRGGCQATAYSSIVGGGANASILHYIDNNQKLNEGDLVLVDAAGEYNYYAADITRTYPVNGKFRGEQRAIYELVLQSQLVAIETIRPGASWNAAQEMVVKVLTQGLVDLGLLKGSVDSLIEQKAYEKFYMHRSGHWLGLDVHDVGAYNENNQWRKLQPGMALTVEPGIYINAQAPVDKRWHNIGVRIEDDVVVTETGHEMLSKDAPKKIDEIEALMKAK